MFTKTAAFYDAIYAARGKDYAGEAAWLRAAIAGERSESALKLLDVACGTGVHLSMLDAHFTVSGLDADEAMIAIARQRLPGIPLRVAQMQDFTIGDPVDVLVCLGSSIGYVRELADLEGTIAHFGRALGTNGIAIVEPWLSPTDWREEAIGAVFVDRPQLKIARVDTSERYGRISVLRFEYLVGEPSGISRFNETHTLGLFSEEEYRTAFERAGFHVRLERTDIFPRGLYVARKR